MYDKRTFIFTFHKKYYYAKITWVEDTYFTKSCSPSSNMTHFDPISRKMHPFHAILARNQALTREKCGWNPAPPAETGLEF